MDLAAASASIVESNIDCPYQSNKILADKLISSDRARSNTDSRVLSDTEARGTSPCGSIGSSMEQFEDVKIFLSPHFNQVFDGGYIDEFGSCSEEMDLAAASAPIVESNIDCPYKSNEIVADKFERMIWMSWVCTLNR